MRVYPLAVPMPHPAHIVWRLCCRAGRASSREWTPNSFVSACRLIGSFSRPVSRNASPGRLVLASRLMPGEPVGGVGLSISIQPRIGNSRTGARALSICQERSGIPTSADRTGLTRRCLRMTGGSTAMHAQFGRPKRTTPLASHNT
jgi:hypothetical protein